MKHPIRLNTAYGAEQFNILASQMRHYDAIGELQSFRDRCFKDYRMQERNLNFFLDDDSMSMRYKMTEDDTEGFMIFNRQSDVCSCLLYFSGKWKE